MANLTITAANVGIATDTGDIRAVQVGEAVTQGQPGYLSANKYWKADATTAAKANAQVIFLTAAAIDGYALALFAGKYIVGATVVVGTTYVVSATSGLIAPIADLVTGNFPTIIGTADTTTTIPFSPVASGIAKA